MSKKGSTLKETISSMGANSFLYEMSLICKGGNNENDKLLPLEVNPFTLTLI